jgi:hypothetical protein
VQQLLQPATCSSRSCTKAHKVSPCNAVTNVWQGSQLPV